MTHILNYRFPTDIALGAVGGPEFHTDIIETPQGQEQRHIRRSQPRARYHLSYGLKSVTQLDQVRALYYLAKGRAYGFKYKDPLDHQASNQNIAKGDGETKNFQLIKTYKLDDKVCFKRKIMCPHHDKIEVRVNNEVVQNYILESNGVISFEEAPVENAIITASFNFDVPVRFDTDFLAQKIEGPNAALIDNIQLIEIL